jgi:salicylate hydroxylase
MNLRIGIVGAGIGGLTAAIALAADGHRVVVYEQSEQLGDIGAGIQLSPNATRVLHHLGLLAAVERWAVAPATGDLRRWDDGSVLVSQPLGDVVRRRFGFPYLHVHRADLHRVLAEAAIATNGCRVRLGYRVDGFEMAGSMVGVSASDRMGDDLDVLVGADGIHSEIRRRLFGPERPRFSGSCAWRGLVEASAVADLGLPVASHAFLGPDQHLVCYYVGAGRLVNWVGVAPSATWTLESWTAPGELEEALADYEGWCPTVRGLIAAVGDRPLYRWALYDRDPLPRWGDGPVTLLGDACHPMLPFMAQGAAQAIEDAAVLRGCLAQGRDPVAALRRYEDLRRDRTARVQLAARANETMFHLPDGPEQQARDARLASPESRAAHRNAWLFDYDATAAADLG